MLAYVEEAGTTEQNLLGEWKAMDRLKPHLNF